MCFDTIVEKKIHPFVNVSINLNLYVKISRQINIQFFHNTWNISSQFNSLLNSDRGGLESGAIIVKQNTIYMYAYSSKTTKHITAGYRVLESVYFRTCPWGSRSGRVMSPLERNVRSPL